MTEEINSRSRKRFPKPTAKTKASRKVNLGKVGGMTSMQINFAKEYVKDFRPMEAYLRLRPEMKPENASKAAYIMRRIPIVAEYIRDLMLAQDEDAKVNALFVQIELLRQYRVAAESASIGEKSRPAERGNALRALENLGRLATVRAFRDGIGQGMPNQDDYDYSVLTDEELETFERLSQKAALARGDESGNEAEEGARGKE